VASFLTSSFLSFLASGWGELPLRSPTLLECDPDPGLNE
jgi:hypothetical protein